jgi:hypothetical protein
MIEIKPTSGRAGLLRGTAALATILALAAIAGGCSSISTPLPDIIRPPANASLSDKERKEAVDELTRKRETHEQDAEQQIEQSR